MESVLSDPDVRLATAIVAILFALVGTMGNGAVLYILLCGPKIPMSSSKFLVIVLAIFDFVTCVFILPIELADMMAGIHTGSTPSVTEAYCKACSFFSIYIACLKFHIVLLISVERYILICHPLQATTLIDLRKVCKAVAVIMTVAFVMALPLPLKFSSVGGRRLNGTEAALCSWDQERDDSQVEWKLYYTILFALYYVIPLIGTTCAYSCTFRTLHRSRRPSIVNQTNTEDAKLRVSLSKLMLSIAILFAALNTPYFLTTLLVSFGVPAPDSAAFTITILNYSLGLNSVINPFIYCSHTKSFFKSKIVALFRPASYESENAKDNPQTLRFWSSDGIQFGQRVVAYCMGLYD